MNLPVQIQRYGETDFCSDAAPPGSPTRMTVALMIFDYVDRQVIVSMFPFLKAEWNLSDKELGLLVSVISITVAVFGIPVAWIADRVSRVKSIVVMAVLWSLACISCMFAQSYVQLLLARAVVGLGEAGYGSVGAAMVAAHFPQRMRGGLLGGFLPRHRSARCLASFWVASSPHVLAGRRRSVSSAFPACSSHCCISSCATTRPSVTQCHRYGRSVEQAADMIRTIFGSVTVRWVCIGAAAQLIAVSALWAWLPSFLNRIYGIAPDKAGIQAALVVLAGAAGSLVLGAIARPRRCPPRERQVHRRRDHEFLSMVTLMFAFGSGHVGW